VGACFNVDPVKREREEKKASYELFFSTHSRRVPKRNSRHPTIRREEKGGRGRREEEVVSRGLCADMSQALQK